MKIKILIEYDPQDLEKSVSESVADKHMVNIQFRTSNYPDYFVFVTYGDGDN